MSFIKRIPMPSGVTSAMGQGTAAMAAAAGINSIPGAPRRGGKKRRKAKAKTTRKRKRSRARVGKKKRSKRKKLVKGSAAAKAWGRKMKSLRKR